MLIENDLNDSKSIIEQFQASLDLGPSVIFIDGLDEISTKQKLSSWLPKIIETESKFVFTIRKSSEYYAEFQANKHCVSFELITFKNENDYHSLFGKLLDLNTNSKENSNVLFGKYMSISSDFQAAHHASNPLYSKLIALEIFSFDKDIFKASAANLSARVGANSRVDSTTSSSVGIYDDVKVNSSLSYSSMSSSSNRTNNSVNIMENYIEEVSTLRELIQKIIKRYIKKNNWSTNSSVPISLES